MKKKRIVCSKFTSTFLRKLLLTMKLTVFLILSGMMTVHANKVFSQTVLLSMQMKSVSVEKVLEEIKKQCNYDFICDYEYLKELKKVDVHFKAASLDEVLYEVLKNTNLDYRIEAEMIVLFPRKAVKPDAKKKQNTLVQQKEKNIKGKVVDETGFALPGASILVKGTGIGTVTNAEGHFTLKIPQEHNIIVVSFMGMITQELDISNETNLEILLLPEVSDIDEIVVIAYGTRKKGSISGSVSTIKAEKMETVPAAGFDQSLQGSTPGLTVLSSSGEPSKPATFQIRGTNSINSGTSPLFILDGVPISSSDFNTINPGDIESVSVLKDASSTSIYGARAANGVVVITTKRGQSKDGAKFSFRTQHGISMLSGTNWKMMNTAERIQYEKEIGLDEGKDYTKLQSIDVNWLDVVFNDAAPLQNYELSVSGNTKDINYFVSGNVYDQEGITIGSSFRRYNTRANVEIRASEKFKLGTNTMLTYEEIETAEEGQYKLYAPISASRFMLPYWNPYQKDGTLASVNDNTWKGTGQNPLEWMQNNPVFNKKQKMISTLFAQFQPHEKWIIRSQLGIDFTRSTAFMQSMPSYMPNNGEGQSGRSQSSVLNLSVTNTVTYQFDIDNQHHFNFLVGQEGVDYEQEGFAVTTRGQINDNLVNVSTGTNALSWSDVTSSYAYLSFFGRGEYNYLGKYYADFSIRTDGSSRFGADSRWATFWSLGLMWNLRKEDFMEDVKWLSNCQLAFSTGTSGNSSIPNYDHLALVGGNVDYYGQAGLAPLQRGNEDLSWEKLWSTNLALRLGFWSKANLNIEFYNKQTTNMLMSVPVSYSDGGYGFQWDNIGAMNNRGFELAGDVNLFQTQKFNWNINANVSYNRNKLIELYGDADEYTVSTTGVRLVVGHPVSEFYLNRFAGVNPNNGDALWYTKNGEVTTEFNESDRVMTGKSYVAPWQGGFGTELNYKKNWSLSAQFSWMADRYLMNNDRYFEESNGLYAVYNQSNRLLYDRWKKTGDMTDIPRHGVPPQFDDRFLEQASFLRLKNLMISYTFRENALRKIARVEKLRLYAQGQNLLTFTKFSGIDPETNNNLYRAQYPLTKQFTLGLELVF